MSRPPLEDRIPMILERTDLGVLVAEVAGPPVRQRGDTLEFHCPHPNHDDHNPSFTVSLSGARQSWRCWSRCGAGGDAVTFVRWLRGVSNRDAIDYLAERLGDDRHMTPQPPPHRQPVHPREQPTAEAPVRLADDAARPILERFLAERRWLPVVAEELGLAVVTRSGRPSIRFPFPSNGDQTWYQDRRIEPGKPKWISPPGTTPWPFEAQRIAQGRQTGELFIVEGVSDTVAIINEFPDAAVIGIPGAGGFKTAWANVIGYLDLVVIGDNDDGGQAFRQRADELLTPTARTVRHLMVPAEFNDVDDWRRANVGGFPYHLVSLARRLGMEGAMAA